MSSTVGNSSNSSPGGIPDFYLLSDQNAAASMQKNALGLYTNLDFILLSDIGKQNLWKYDAQSNKPTLGHPIMGLLRLNNTSDENKVEWQEIFEKLINKLPADIKAAHDENEKKELQEQNPALIALTQLLKTTAEAIAFLKTSVNGLDPQNPIAAPGSELSERQIANLNLSNVALQGMVDQAASLFNAFKAQVLLKGANNTDFDKFTGLLNNLGSSFEALLNANLDE